MTVQEIDERFKKYAEFSVRVDRYYNWTNAVINHFPNLRSLHQTANGIKKTIDFSKEKRSEISNFAIQTISFFNYFETTGVFSTDDFSDFETNDIQNFSFYTSYCFQWTLFENFVIEMIQNFARKNFFSPEVKSEINKYRYQTKKIFDLLETGRILGTSPFKTVLPKYSWQQEFIEYDFNNLNLIREKRNNYIHGNIDVNISPEHIAEKQREYSLTMWILRKFSENVYFLLRKKIETLSMDSTTA